MSALTDEWNALLTANAADYALVALTNIGREFPSDVRCLMTAPGDFPNRPRDRTPVFYGSFDWHSCVEMHWLLVRLLRTAHDHVPHREMRATLDAQFTAEALQAEARFVADPNAGARQRPYGWGWALALIHEVSALRDERPGERLDERRGDGQGNGLDERRGDGRDGRLDEDAVRWARYLRPLADTITARFLEWLPKATYPVRYGMHVNSAFGLSRSLPHAVDRAEAGDPALLDAITDAAHRWFGQDTDYPGGWEPSGSDFLSPALVEAELMASVLPPERFVPWLDAFLPKLADREPAALFTPAVVSDSTDGQIAHLHGLNASRAWCWRRLAELLPPTDPRVEPMTEAARVHADAALPHVVGDHYMVEHWLAAYAMLLLRP